MKFANYILEDKELIDKLEENKMIGRLTFGFSEITILENITSVGNKRGYNFVNIENWVILIYFYYALNFIKWQLPKNNLFVEAIKAGDKDNRDLIGKEKSYYYFYHDVLFNGFYTYYRFLMLTCIFNKGKAVNSSSYDKIDNLNCRCLV